MCLIEYVKMSAMSSQITSLTIVYSTVYSGADQRKHQSFASLAFARGIHQGPVNSPHKGPVTRRVFPFDDVIMLFHPPVLSRHPTLYWTRYQLSMMGLKLICISNGSPRCHCFNIDKHVKTHKSMSPWFLTRMGKRVCPQVISLIWPKAKYLIYTNICLLHLYDWCKSAYNMLWSLLISHNIECLKIY